MNLDNIQLSYFTNYIWKSCAVVTVLSALSTAVAVIAAKHFGPSTVPGGSAVVAAAILTYSTICFSILTGLTAISHLFARTFDTLAAEMDKT